MIAEVLNSYALTLDYLRSLVEEVPQEELSRQCGGMINHPLWTIGHLVFAAQMIGGDLGLSPWLQDDWGQRYGTGSIPTAERSAYPTKESLLNQLADAERRLTEQLRNVGDAALQQLMPDVRYREIFPTLGHAVTHVLCAHTAAHVGQIIVWRRLMGYPPLSKVFD